VTFVLATLGCFPPDITDLFEPAMARLIEVFPADRLAVPDVFTDAQLTKANNLLARGKPVRF